MITDEKTVVVNLGEVFVTKDPGTVLSCVGLGSCVAVCAYDPYAKIGGMAHVVLPYSNGNHVPSPKFADIAVPLLLNKMQEKGAYRIRLVIKIAGGARMGLLNNQVANSIGAKNAQAVMDILANNGIKLAASETGGSRGRSVRLHLSTGKVFVKTIGSEGHEI
jgi:chemotaxis protein CheD